MANRYWRGGTGTWNTTNTTNWSITSGGSGGASVPTTADDVFFDANSGGGTVTVSGTVSCLTINASAYTGNFAHSSGVIQVASTATTTVINFSSATTSMLASGLTFNLTGNPAVIGTRTVNIRNTSSNRVNINVKAGTRPSDVAFVSASGIHLDSLDLTGSTSTVSATSAQNLQIYQSILFASATDPSVSFYVYLTPTAGNTCTADFKGVLVETINLNGDGTVNLTGAANPAQLTITKGTLNTNNFTVTVAYLLILGTGTKTLNLGSSTINVRNNSGISSNNILILSGTTNLTINPGTSILNLNYTSTNNRAITNSTAISPTFGELRFSGSGTGIPTFTGPFTFTTVSSTRTAAQTIYFASGATLTASNFNASGASGQVLSFWSDVPGNTWNLVQTSGTVFVDYVNLRGSQASGGADFYTGLNSTDSGTNSGWVFNSAVAYPSGISATGSVGTVSLNTDQIISVTGVSGTTFLGTAIVPNIYVSVTGVSGTGIIGTLPQTVVFVTGTQATGQIGTVDVPFVADVFGVQGTIYLANVTVGVAVYPTGFQANMTMGKVAVWIAVDSAQTTTWTPINTLQY